MREREGSSPSSGIWLGNVYCEHMPQNLTGNLRGIIGAVGKYFPAIGTAASAVAHAGEDNNMVDTLAHARSDHRTMKAISGAASALSSLAKGPEAFAGSLLDTINNLRIANNTWNGRDNLAAKLRGEAPGRPVHTVAGTGTLPGNMSALQVQGGFSR